MLSRVGSIVILLGLGCAGAAPGRECQCTASQRDGAQTYHYGLCRSVAFGPNPPDLETTVIQDAPVCNAQAGAGINWHSSCSPNGITGNNRSHPFNIADPPFTFRGGDTVYLATVQTGTRSDRYFVGCRRGQTVGEGAFGTCPPADRIQNNGDGQRVTNLGVLAVSCVNAPPAAASGGGKAGDSGSENGENNGPDRH